MVSMCLLQGCTPQWLFQPKEVPLYPEWPNMDDYYEHVIQPDDKITLSIWGHDELGVGSSFSVYSSTLESGKYIVIDQQGEVSLPLIGKVRLAGLTAREADLFLNKLYSKFVKTPIIYLRVLNHMVTLFGEVNSPGNYTLVKQQTPLLEILGEAGGFTKYADKAHIKILRYREGRAWEEIFIDLTDLETLNQSSLILRSKDLIYIPERKIKATEQAIGNTLVPVVGVLGTLAIIVSLLK
ncbi:MAG: polysaccharide biosynthesis/export family protein [Bacteroidota bacterium]